MSDILINQKLMSQILEWGILGTSETPTKSSLINI